MKLLPSRRSSRQHGPAANRLRARPAAWIRPRLERLEDRIVLAVDYSAFAAGIDTGLKGVQSAIHSALDSAPNLPIIGSHVGDLSNAAVLPDSVVNTLHDAVGGLSSPKPGDIQNAVAGAFGGLVVNGPAGVKVTGDLVAVVEIEVHLHKDVSAPAGSLNVNLGLKSLPVTVATTGGVQVGVGFDYELAFKFDGTFSIDTGPKLASGHQLDLIADATLTSGFKADATLGFFTAKATDEAANHTEFKATLSVDNLGTTGTKLTVGGTANLNLHLDAAIGGSGDTDSFPSVGTNFELHWAFNGDTMGSAPTVAFNNVSMSAGTLFNKIVKPLVNDIQTFTQPIQPIIDVLKAPIPGLTDLSHLIGGGDVTLEGIIQTVAANAGDPELQAIVNLATILVDLTNDIDKIDTSGPNLMIDFGSFTLGGAANDLRSFASAKDPKTTPYGTPLTDLLPAGATNTVVSDLLKVTGVDADAAQKALDFINGKRDGFKFSFPILDDPANGIFQLLLGRDVSLFKLTLDENADATEGVSFPALGILSIGFEGVVHVKLHAEVGYDTLGIREFLQDGKIGDLSDGQYVTSDTVFDMSGHFGAFATATYLVFSAGVTGGLTIPDDNQLHVTFHNPTDSPGHIPFSKLDPKEYFDASGEVDAGLNAFVKVGVKLPVVGFVGWQKSFPIANVKLQDFGGGTKIPKGGLLPDSPSIATRDGSGVVTLSIGDHATDLVGFKAPDNGGANYTVAADPGDATAIDVTAFGFTQVFHNVSKIVADGTYSSDPGKTGADAITVLDGVTVPAELHGNKAATSNSLTYRGTGKAKLYAGDHGDILATGKGDNAELYGGAGDDVLTAGDGNGDILNGGGGNNVLTAGNGNNDSLNGGGDGNNQLEAGSGQDDVLIGGGAGNNTITVHAGDHARTIYGAGGPGQTVSNPGVDTLIVQGGDGARLTASASGSAVQVTTQTSGDVFVGHDIQSLVLNGGKGDVININDLTGTPLTQVVADQIQATKPDGATHVVNVDASGATGGLAIDQSVGVTAAAGVEDKNLVGQDNNAAVVSGALAEVIPILLHYRVFAPLNDAQDTLAVNNVPRPTSIFGIYIETLNVDSQNSDLTLYGSGGRPNPIALPGLLSVQTQAGPEIVVISTAGPTVLKLGNDNVVDAGTFSFNSTPSNTLGDLKGPLTIHGSGVGDRLVVDDSGLTTSVTGLLTATALTGLDLGNPAGIAYDGLSVLSVTLGSGKNIQFNVQGTAAGTNTSIAGSTGSESFNVGSKQYDTAVSGSVLDTIQGPLTVSGTGADYLWVDDTGSTTATTGTLTATTFTGMGMGPRGITYGRLGTLGIFLGTGGATINVQSTAAPTTTYILASTGNPNTFNVGSLAPASGGIVDYIAGPLVIAGSGADVMNVDDTGSTKAKIGQLTASTLTGMGMGPQGIAYFGLKSLNIFVGTGGDTINVQSTAAPTTTTIDPPTGSPNTFNIGSLAPFGGGIVDNIAGPLVIVGGGGDTMNVDDTGSTTAKTGTLTASTLTGLNMAGITYSGLAVLNLALGSGGNALAISVAGGTNLPATTTINGGPSSSDSLAATWAQDFNGTLTLVGFEQSTIQVGRDFNGAMSDTQPGNNQSLTIGRSLTAPASLLAGNIDTMSVGQDLAGLVTALGYISTLSVGGLVTYLGRVIAGGNLTEMTVGPDAFSSGHDMAGQVIIGGTLSDLRVAGGTPGNVTAGHVGTIRTYGGYGPYVLQVLENGIQRRVEAAVPGSPYPLLHSPPLAPVTSPAGVTFQYIYESGSLANPQLTVRVTNGSPVADQYDLSLVTYNDVAKFNLARLDAAGVSGVRNVAVEGDLLPAVTAGAASFFMLPGNAIDATPAGVRLGQDVLAGVAVRDYAPNGFIQAAGIQAVAFGSHTRPDGRSEPGAAAHQDDAARLLTAGTAVVQASDTFRVPFADLPAQQVGFFLDTDEHGGHFDNNNIAFIVQGVGAPNTTLTGNVVTPSNVARGAVTALVSAAKTFDAHGNLEDSVVQTVDLRGDGASFLTEQFIAAGVTSTGPLGDLTYQADHGITNVTAPSIFGSILPNGPITGTVQTTGQRVDPISGVTSPVPADLGRLFVVMTDKGPVLTTTTMTVKGPGLSGRLVVRGNLVSQVSSDGGISGVVAVGGNVAETNAADKNGHAVRLGGITSSGPISGQIVVLGTLAGDLTARGGLKGGRIAVRGDIVGNVDIEGSLDAASALVSGGKIGDAAAGTTLTAGDVQGILAAEGSINLGKPANTGKAAFFGGNLRSTDPTDTAAVDAVFTNNHLALGFDLGGLDLGGLALILSNLNSLIVKNHGLSGTTA